MIILNSASESIRIITGNPVATNNIPAYASFRQTTNTTFTPKSSAVDVDGVSASGTTLVNGVDGYSIGVDYISIYNADTSTAYLNIVYNKNATDYTLWIGYVYTGERVEYNKKGFVLKDARGIEKQVIKTDYTNMLSTSTFNTTTITATLSNSTTSFADVTDLQFPVLANRLYWFRFVIRYKSAITTTGAAFAINGPTQTYLYYNGECSAAATTMAFSPNRTTYDSAVVATNSSNTPNCRAIMEGLIQPTAE